MKDRKTTCETGSNVQNNAGAAYNIQKQQQLLLQLLLQQQQQLQLQQLQLQLQQQHTGSAGVTIGPPPRIGSHPFPMGRAWESSAPFEGVG